jgi:hypothetical protein
MPKMIEQQLVDVPAVTGLTGAQIKTLREGLQKAFPDTVRFGMFLLEDLDRRLAYYVGPNDPMPIACFRTIEAAVAEGWAGFLIVKAHQSRTHIAELTTIADQIRKGIKPPPEAEEAARTESTLWREFNPYRGLEALQEHDADFLFGRNADIDRFIEVIATDQSKILLALGASGVHAHAPLAALALRRLELDKGALEHCKAASSISARLVAQPFSTHPGNSKAWALLRFQWPAALGSTGMRAYLRCAVSKWCWCRRSAVDSLGRLDPLGAHGVEALRAKALDDKVSISSSSEISESAHCLRLSSAKQHLGFRGWECPPCTEVGEVTDAVVCQRLSTLFRCCDKAMRISQDRPLEQLLRRSTALVDAQCA